jgi:DNA-binding IscR family transcriptional regulator
MYRLSKRGFVAEMEEGYLLARPPENIHLDEVLQLFQGFAPKSPGLKSSDALDGVLTNIDDAVRSQTRSVTFAQLI